MGMIVVDNQYGDLALAMINQSKRDICLSTFKIEKNDKPKGRLLEQIFNALLRKRAEGINIKLLFNWHDDKKSIARTNQSAGTFLKQRGIEVRHLKDNRCCHAKTLIIDEDKAIIGSHNLSCKSLSNNFEISYLITEPETVKQLKSIFSNSWMNAKDF
jgi:phosphatidylserine/phosphatidylglycerophosphate/cardiolipin synthase-like enzyme